MIELPPVAPVRGWRTTTRLPRDHYVRVDANDYSVLPSVIGRRVEVVTDLARVVITFHCQHVAGARPVVGGASEQHRRVVRVEGTVPWLVVAPEGAPVEPIRRYLADLVAQGNSPSSVRSYAYDLMR